MAPEMGWESSKGRYKGTGHLGCPAGMSWRYMFPLLSKVGDSSVCGLGEISRHPAHVLLPCSCLICSQASSPEEERFLVLPQMLSLAESHLDVQSHLETLGSF